MAPRVPPVCSLQVAVPTSSRLEGQLGAKWAVGRDKKTLLLTFPLPSGGSSFEQAEGSLPAFTREARERILGISSIAPKLQPVLEGGHSEGGVCSAGPPAWLFWSLPGLCQSPAFPRTSPKGLGGSPGPHFLPGEINQLSNHSDT